MGDLGRCFGALGGSWGASWGVLAASWGVLAASWSVLGSSWAVLRASWGPLGRLKSFWTQQAPALGQTYVPKGGQDGAQMGAKVCQNRRQNGPKSKTKTKTKKEALEDRLGAVLGRSWVVLVPSWGQNRALAYGGAHFLKIDRLKKMRVQEATWVDLGSIWVAQGGSR